MAKIREELEKIVNIVIDEDEEYQEYLNRLVNTVDLFLTAEDEKTGKSITYSNMRIDVRDWFDAACKVVNKSGKIVDFLDNDEVEESKKKKTKRAIAGKRKVEAKEKEEESTPEIESSSKGFLKAEKAEIEQRYKISDGDDVVRVTCIRISKKAGKVIFKTDAGVVHRIPFAQNIRLAEAVEETKKSEEVEEIIKEKKEVEKKEKVLVKKGKGSKDTQILGVDVAIRKLVPVDREMKLSEITDTYSCRDHGDIEELKKSIEEIGLLNPITINQHNKLLAGRRRFQAVKELGWVDVPCSVVTTFEKSSDLKIAIVENIHRKQLTTVEMSIAIKEYDEHKRKTVGEKVPGGKAGARNTRNGKEGWTLEKTAEDLNISISTVRRAIEIAKAVKENPELVKETGSDILEKVKHNNLQKDKVFDAIVFNLISKEDIQQLQDIELPAKKDCLVWLWVTNDRIEEGFALLKRWGLEYLNILTRNFGYFQVGVLFKNKTKHCLVAKLGDPVVNAVEHGTYIEAIGDSEFVPKEFYRIVESTSIGKKLDYCSNIEKDGWSNRSDIVVKKKK